MEPQKISDGKRKILDVFRLFFDASTLVRLSPFLVLLGGSLLIELSFQAIDCRFGRPDTLRKDPATFSLLNTPSVTCLLDSTCQSRVARFKKGPVAGHIPNRAVGLANRSGSRAGLKNQGIRRFRHVIPTVWAKMEGGRPSQKNPTTRSNFRNPQKISIRE